MSHKLCSPFRVKTYHPLLGTDTVVSLLNKELKEFSRINIFRNGDGSSQNNAGTGGKGCNVVYNVIHRMPAYLTAGNG